MENSDPWFCVVSNMAFDGLVLQGAKVSAAMVLI